MMWARASRSCGDRRELLGCYISETHTAATGTHERGRSRLHMVFGDGVLFALGAEDAVDRIWGAAGGFVVVAHLHFTQEAYRQHVQASQDQHSGKSSRGPWLAIIGV